MSITLNALIKRINRKLRPDLMMLRIARSERTAQQLGWYYVHDLSRNFVTETFVNPEMLGRELDVLRAHEQVAA